MTRAVRFCCSVRLGQQAWPRHLDCYARASQCDARDGRDRLPLPGTTNPNVTKSSQDSWKSIWRLFPLLLSPVRYAFPLVTSCYFLLPPATGTVMRSPRVGGHLVRAPEGAIARLGRSLLRYGQDPRYGGGELSVHRHPRFAAAAFVHGPAYSCCREVLGGYWRCENREIDRQIGDISEIDNEADLALNLGVRRRRSSGAVRAPNPPGAYPTLINSISPSFLTCETSSSATGAAQAGEYPATAPPQQHTMETIPSKHARARSPKASSTPV